MESPGTLPSTSGGESRVTHLDSSEIDTCLDHTVGKVGDSAQPGEG